MAQSSLKTKNIHYFVKDMQDFANKKVIIAGGGDSAIDWALMLEQVAAEVSIIHRRPEFRGHEHSVEKLKESTVQVLTPFMIEQLHVVK